MKLQKETACTTGSLNTALKFAWPIIERERYKLEGSYGKNFDSAKADRARQACEKAKAALAKLEESHD